MKTIIDKNTGEVLYATALEVDINENEMAISEIVTEPFYKARFSFETRTFYEAATTQEISEMNSAIVPAEIALWRIRVILKTMGLESTIEGVLEQLSEPTKTGAKYIWQFGTVIERESQTVIILQQALGMTNQQVDEMFIQAEQIKL